MNYLPAENWYAVYAWDEEGHDPDLHLEPLACWRIKSEEWLDVVHYDLVGVESSDGGLQEVDPDGAFVGYWHATSIRSEQRLTQMVPSRVAKLVHDYVNEVVYV